MSDNGRKNELSRAKVRSIVDYTLTVQAASPEIRDLAMLIVGVNNVRDFVVANLTRAKGETNALADIDALSKANQIDAVVDATEMGKDRLKAIWKTLSALDIVTGAMNASDPKAAGAIVRALSGMDYEQKRELAQAAALLGAN
ncbi:hypothetical protein [Aeromicrobium sp. 179-A 4D2 NHS]|uniref:hypothetical protein n=1 Tax=Aeromicrobium sp. 179-A 4D2 NHS TaxID=3142375 RepID=UPI0039A03346